MTTKVTKFRNPFALRLFAAEKGHKLILNKPGTQLQAYKGHTLIAMAFVHSELTKNFEPYREAPQ